MNDAIKYVIKYLKQKEYLLNSKEVTIGFDGFIDSIVRIVKNKSCNEDVYFDKMSEFGSYISDKQGKSCSLELKEQVKKIGGNMPILSHALGTLGLKVNCIGCMGFPSINPIFNNISSSCMLYSIAESGYTTALEFNDGKIMMAEMSSIDSVDWVSIKKIIGLHVLKHFFDNSDLIGIVNWSEVSESNSIWRGIVEEILPSHTPNKNQIVCFDFADCSKRHREELLYAFSLMNQFSKHYKVLLSLNENEARLIYTALYGMESPNDITTIGNLIYNKLNIDTLVIHSVKYSIAWEGGKLYSINNFYLDFPKLSTGGGDNFNAGLCTAQLMGLDIESSLVLASAAGSFYVGHGYSGNMMQLIEYLSQKENLLDYPEENIL